jgi:hypothetical protein
MSLLSKYKERKAKLIKRVGQYIADQMIVMMEHSVHEFQFYYWFNMALRLELILYCHYGIELE